MQCITKGFKLMRFKNATGRISYSLKKLSEKNASQRACSFTKSMQVDMVKIQKTLLTVVTSFERQLAHFSPAITQGWLINEYICGTRTVMYFGVTALFRIFNSKKLSWQYLYKSGGNNHKSLKENEPGWYSRAHTKLDNNKRRGWLDSS